MKLTITALFVALCCGGAQAQNVIVRDAWVRATVPGQMATGAFMKITAKEGGTLVSASSPSAGVAEVHEMKIEGGVMKMRAVAGGLNLPAGKVVELKPGSYHVMLLDLKEPLRVGAVVPLNLVVKNAKGGESRINMTVAVTMAAPADATAADHSEPKP